MQAGKENLGKAAGDGAERRLALCNGNSMRLLTKALIVCKVYKLRGVFCYERAVF